MNNWLNQKRLRVYPRLFLVTMAIVLAANVLLGSGWMGASGQRIGGDFVMLYSAGVLFGQEPEQLYNFERQGQVQKSLLAPTPFDGIMPYNYPPYVAWLIQPLTHLPMAWAMAIWTVATLVFAVLAAHLIARQFISPDLKSAGLDFRQLLIITFSFFAFIEGLQVGQNHGLTLLLTTGILVASMKKRWLLAGILAGLSIYKPQFALGFLIIWLVWGQWRALLGYGVVVAAWAGGFLALHGSALYVEYFQNLPLLLKMVYLEGFGGYLEVTPYGLLISVLPPSAWSEIVTFTNLLAVVLGVGLAIYAWRVRRYPPERQIPALLLAVLFPLLAAPHTLLHDLVILVPLLALWARLWPSRRLLMACVVIYLAAFFLPWINHTIQIPLLAFIPIGLFAWLVIHIVQDYRKYPKLNLT